MQITVDCTGDWSHNQQVSWDGLSFSAKGETKLTNEAPNTQNAAVRATKHRDVRSSIAKYRT